MFASPCTVIEPATLKDEFDELPRTHGTTAPEKGGWAKSIAPPD